MAGRQPCLLLDLLPSELLPQLAAPLSPADRRSLALCCSALAAATREVTSAVLVSTAGELPALAAFARFPHLRKLVLRDGAKLYVEDPGRWQVVLAAVAAAVRHGRSTGFQLELLQLGKGTDEAEIISLQLLEEDFAAAGTPLSQLTRGVSVADACLDGGLTSSLTEAYGVLISDKEELDGLEKLQQYRALEALELWTRPELPSPDLGCLAALPRLRSLTADMSAGAMPLDAARQLVLPHLTCLRLSGAALEGRAFTRLLHLTSLSELSVTLPHTDALDLLARRTDYQDVSALSALSQLQSLTVGGGWGVWSPQRLSRLAQLTLLHLSAANEASMYIASNVPQYLSLKGGMLKLRHAIISLPKLGSHGAFGEYLYTDSGREGFRWWPRSGKGLPRALEEVEINGLDLCRHLYKLFDNGEVEHLLQQVDGGYAKSTVEGLANIRTMSLTGGRLGWAWLYDYPRQGLSKLAEAVFKSSFVDRRGRHWERSATCSLGKPLILDGASGFKEIWYSIVYTMQPHCPGVASE